MYDVLNANSTYGEEVPALSRLKAKIVKLHSDRLTNFLRDTNEKDRVEGEKPTLYHILQMQKQRTYNKNHPKYTRRPRTNTYTTRHCISIYDLPQEQARHNRDG